MTLPSGSGHRPVTQFHHQGRVRHHDCFALRAEPQTMRCRVSLGLATNKALRSRKIDLIGHIHDFEDQDFTIGERDHSRGGADFVTLQPNSAPACGWRTKVGCQRSVSLVIVSDRDTAKPRRTGGPLFKVVSTVGVLAIVNGIGFAVVVVLFAKWLWILIALVVGVGGGFLLLRWARTLADPAP